MERISRSPRARKKEGMVDALLFCQTRETYDQIPKRSF